MREYMRTFAIVGVLLMFSAASGGELNPHIPSRSFIVSVAPVDRESRDAENSILYQSTARDDQWLALGECEKVTLPGGDVRFTREVTVKKDGIYLYTSRPVVSGKIVEPPSADSPPQAVVVVDTLAPIAEITSLGDSHVVPPGETVALAWTCADENLADAPAALFYTTDAGKSWSLIGRDLPAEGELPWTAPADLSGSALVRLTAVDKAGNQGRDVRRLETLTRTPLPAAGPELAALPDDPVPAKAAEPETRVRDPKRSWLYYLMAINLMKQNKPADALQYYWLSVKEDPEFIDAWADIGLAYIDLGAYKTAREVVTETRRKAPERVDLIHLLGETYHAEGMALLTEARSTEDRVRAKGLIDQAVEWYGRAITRAAEDWRLAEQAPSFYRLGEVCYYVNLDRDGARAYWKKILELHTPTPNPDLVMWTPEVERGKARRRHQNQTYKRVSLDAWQNWARGYLEQLDDRERAGIRDLMPAQRIAALPCPSGTGTVINPGRDDGRSLFSLPGQLGSPATVEACRAVSSSGAVPTVEMNMPRLSHRNPVAENYSFYAKDDRRAGNSAHPAVSTPRGRSVFTGGPDRPTPLNPDPYAFPQANRPAAAWNSVGPYGDKPVATW